MVKVTTCYYSGWKITPPPAKRNLLLDWYWLSFCSWHIHSYFTLFIVQLYNNRGFGSLHLIKKLLEVALFIPIFGRWEFIFYYNMLLFWLTWWVQIQHCICSWSNSHSYCYWYSKDKHFGILHYWQWTSWLIFFYLLFIIIPNLKCFGHAYVVEIVITNNNLLYKSSLIGSYNSLKFRKDEIYLGCY